MVVSMWKKGMESLYHADAQKVADEIMSIGDSATPEQIVEKAKNKNTELHKCFTWDNGKAAKKWRLHEARQIVCHLVYREEEPEKERQEYRVFHKVEKSEGYVPVVTIFRKEEMYAQLLRNALGELKAFQKKYTFLSDRQELAALISSIEVQIERETV